MTRFITIVVIVALSFLASPPAGAGPLPEKGLTVRTLCDECGDPDLPEPSQPPGDDELGIIFRALFGDPDDSPQP